MPSVDTPEFEPTWTSLRRHQTPQWLIDAKFGMYCHWGLGSIQQQPGCEDYTPEQAVEYFTAEAFDPAEWAELFEKTGAKFAGPICWHGSPFLHWDSKLDDFNSVKQNPHRDIMGELATAIRARGLKFFGSFHSISDDGWMERAMEAVDLHHPDVFWVDASFGGTKQSHHLKIVHQSHYLGPDESTPYDPDAPNPGHFPPGGIERLSDHNQRAFLAYLFNDAQRRGADIEFIYKSHDIPPGVGMRDLENGLLDHVAYDPWMTDVDMNISPDWNVHGWFHREGLPLRSAANIVRALVDIVSKNGILLLNVPPLPDGSFSDEVRGTLDAVGQWLKVHGEAIYGASPWSVFGEGPTVIKPLNPGSYHHNDHFATTLFTPEDIRLTVNGTSLYATCLGEPVGGRVVVQALSTNFKVMPDTLKNVSLLGSDAPLAWEHGDDGLVIDLPDGFTSSPLANVFKIETL
ncbi:alpha-L-fucosidase [Algisphaera agarilytica]|uniref:alpha-L-fucosidase n=1 Tax=Algisphaera agarilytica TaxID=1385975 RepID=A0A7X0LK17_9BACT|nr:alpha-L-fucosidase [Algisphaera agarilytica]MBB6429359.1 alpha-L-fucosidase [Algisphaera agarilytica]